MKCNWILVTVYIIIIPILLFLNFGQSIQVYIRSGVSYSMADHFVRSVSGSISSLTIIPALVILFFFLTKNDFNSTFVIKQFSRKRLWLKQVYKAGLFALFMTIYITLISYLLGGLLSPEYINWSSKDSVFFSVNKVIAPDISILKVILTFSITYLIKVLVMCILALLIYWLTNKKFISLILILALTLIEAQSFNIDIFYTVININYGLWIKPFGIISGIAYGVGLMLILIGLGILTAKRKEFLNE
ncbi:MAG: hypothetical protein RR844_01235 [Clostridium sp.]